MGSVVVDFEGRWMRREREGERERMEGVGGTERWLR